MSCSAFLFVFRACKVFRQSRRNSTKMTIFNSFLRRRRENFAIFAPKVQFLFENLGFLKLFFGSSVPKAYIQSKTLHSVGQIWRLNVKTLHTECKKKHCPQDDQNAAMNRTSETIGKPRLDTNTSNISHCFLMLPLKRTIVIEIRET